MIPPRVFAQRKQILKAWSKSCGVDDKEGLFGLFVPNPGEIGITR